MSGELVPFPTLGGGMSSEDAARLAAEFLACPGDTRRMRLDDFRLAEAEVLLTLCQLLDQRIDSGPGAVLDATKLAYEHLEHLKAGEGSLLFDEREYYLGELARIAGCCCRFLTLRQEAREWLDRASAWFLLTANSSGDSARVMYQRLALYLEERNLHAVARLAAPLIEAFNRIGARELALKCRFVQATALREEGKKAEAVDVLERLCAEAREINSHRVLGATLVTLMHTYSDLGSSDRAMKLTVEADEYLRTVGDHVSLAKLHWGVGMLLRNEGRPEDALVALRSAQTELLGLEMPADVAALHLIIADVLLEAGQDRQAEWEIRAALPVIDELKMVPEGFAAMSLLRESLHRRSIDRQALRNLHGYFEEARS